MKGLLIELWARLREQTKDGKAARVQPPAGSHTMLRLRELQEAEDGPASAGDSGHRHSPASLFSHPGTPCYVLPLAKPSRRASDEGTCIVHPRVQPHGAQSRVGKRSLAEVWRGCRHQWKIISAGALPPSPDASCLNSCAPQSEGTRRKQQKSSLDQTAPKGQSPNFLTER